MILLKKNLYEGSHQHGGFGILSQTLKTQNPILMKAKRGGARKQISGGGALLRGMLTEI